ncbi:phytanoyl-CoA dioxygenase family protein [Acaryochloris marina]|uniref:Phytanoyl-CoA dioxygenase n=1 Tax=Acaryochloris marina (strain MBIC 11017) TaxID=329726 RepID=B0C9Y9_ACAM1|nr:phytanoyl-CoA dioxygenase family protein [Acaryochloris marina]ABW25429.1 conserved hypothetical protein [Acaryochloris marina MBIC11017]
MQISSNNKIRKFTLSQRKEIKEYFDEFGYVVIKNVLSHNIIDSFIEELDSIKRNLLFVYFSQSTHVCMRPKLNQYGFIQESMKDASRLAFFSRFSLKIQECIYDNCISQALTNLTDEKEHISWQNMFFDQSTGTIEHQDSWYLDTDPPGNLIGVWYALENIYEDSGPFFVIPGSHKYGLIDRKKYSQHNDYLNAVTDVSNKLQAQKKIMSLQKGDILLWHSYLIHGALLCEDSSKSRKSFTSHFYPKKLRAKNTEKRKLFSIYDHKNPKPTLNPNIYSAYKYNDFFYNIIVYLLYSKNILTNIDRAWSMRREDYS